MGSGTPEKLHTHHLNFWAGTLTDFLLLAEKGYSPEGNCI